MQRHGKSGGIGYAVKTVVNDAIRGNACHTWHAEEEIAESQVHLLLACRCDKSVDHTYSPVTPASSREAVAQVEGLLFGDQSEFE